VVLGRRVGEFRLHEELAARHAAGGDGATHRRFHVVFALVGGIDTAETGIEGRARQLLRSFLLPSGAVEEER
jgi:hypothetical protein